MTEKEKAFSVGGNKGFHITFPNGMWLNEKEVAKKKLRRAKKRLEREIKKTFTVIAIDIFMKNGGKFNG